MATRVSGRNFKDWFFEFRKSLNGSNARQIFAGSACEQWINAELFAVISQYLIDTDLIVYPEKWKKDLVVLKVEDSEDVDTVWNSHSAATAIIETKVIYPSYPELECEKRLKKLQNQLFDPKFNSSCNRYGLLIWVFADWGDTHTRKRKISFEGFRTVSGKIFRKWLREIKKNEDGFNITCDQGNSLLTLMPLDEVNVGRIKVKVGALYQYITVRS